MERRAIAIHGTVQGVGFRPFVFGLASSLDLGGFVKNGVGGVRIEVEGERPALDEFVSRVLGQPPPLARIERWSCDARRPRGERRFRIEPSECDSTGEIVVSPDAATCDACVVELFDPNDRRYRYPFLNCTNCGPRLTIVRGAPYDRVRTTMSGFPMCAQCRAEYEDPLDRRFHAQPTACPACGPRLTAIDPRGNEVAAEDEALAYFISIIRGGGIGAMKGIGGYHLVCDARKDAAVAELRRRKHRDEKPFAIMVWDVDAARELCEVSEAERRILTSVRRPIVLLRKRQVLPPLPPGEGRGEGKSPNALEQPGSHSQIPLTPALSRRERGQEASGATLPVANAVAPGNPYLGVMLPYAPLHHLLLHDIGGIPLVMTSGNRSDEPIAYDEPDAFERLAGIADVFLTHDRPIHVRCDDSVTRVIGRREAPIRRSRGDAPQPMPLPIACPVPILAVGGQLKATFALGDDRRAIVSHHMGDLDHFDAYRAFERDIALYEQLFSIRPRCLAHDLHPDYASTGYAKKRAAAEGLKCVAVQHHHAHLGSCMAEHGLREPVIGVTLDGTGYGTDGAVWGGEFLVGDYRAFRRAAHLRYVAMPGGERAIREPWRMAAAHLADAGAACAKWEARVPVASRRTVRQMIERKFNAPMTSSAGRLFDAVASIVGLRDLVSYEGQAAMELEWLAWTVGPCGSYPFEFAEIPGAPAQLGTAGTPLAVSQSDRDLCSVVIAKPQAAIRRDLQFDDSSPLQAKNAIPSDPHVIDTRPLIRAIARDVDAGVPAAEIARRFHSTWVEMIAASCREIRQLTGIATVVSSGGVFMNELLTLETEARLAADGFHVYRHTRVPTNDGGLSLGQVAVAAAQLSTGAAGGGETS
jgi:hydrogenase maturation protein HypF